jgi:hypothetical protein
MKEYHIMYIKGIYNMYSRYAFVHIKLSKGNTRNMCNIEINSHGVKILEINCLAVILSSFFKDKNLSLKEYITFQFESASFFLFFQE